MCDIRLFPVKAMIETSTTSATKLSGSKLRAELMKLVDACPVELCNPDDCPLHEVRQLNNHQRRQWFKALNLTELEYLASYHFVCMKLKLEAHPGLQTQAPSVRV